jgi:alpha-D-ribose 1-methylphosphonate 5-triphosphate diphosphatase PhnM
VQNTVGLGVPVERAVEMAATIPAGALGLTDRGRIAPGMRADLVALDPSSLVVRAVWLGGEPVVGPLEPG